MAALKLAVVPAKVAKDGTHKIRIAIGHKQKTCYIVTRFKIESLSHFKNGQVVGREDSAVINVKLRNLLEDCGIGRSILFDKDDCIIAGNGVYEQAKELGLPVEGTSNRQVWIYLL